MQASTALMADTSDWVGLAVNSNAHNCMLAHAGIVAQEQEPLERSRRAGTSTRLQRSQFA